VSEEKEMGVVVPALTEADLKEVSAATRGHYDDNALSFREGTWDHDVQQNIAALLRHLEGTPPFRVLDFGCGPGRDLVDFSGRGHEAVGLDGSARFCEMARATSGCEVLHQDFLHLSLPEGSFDGVFANASLFHVPGQELPGVLGELHQCLKPRGVLFCSNPRGDDKEGWSGRRYGRYHTLHSWTRILSAAGFEALEHYYRPPGRPRDQQPWLATVWRKASWKGSGQGHG
jgi:SAM-dependent methyltransferase